MLIEIAPYDDFDELNYYLSDIFEFFQYKTARGLIESYMFIVRDLYDLKTEDETDDQTPKIRKHLRRAWHWYKAYLIKSDSEINKQYGDGRK